MFISNLFSFKVDGGTERPVTENIWWREPVFHAISPLVTPVGSHLRLIHCILIVESNYCAFQLNSTDKVNTVCVATVVVILCLSYKQQHLQSFLELHHILKYTALQPVTVPPFFCFGGMNVHFPVLDISPSPTRDSTFTLLPSTHQPF